MISMFSNSFLTGLRMAVVYKDLPAIRKFLENDANIGLVSTTEAFSILTKHATADVVDLLVELNHVEITPNIYCEILKVAARHGDAGTVHASARGILARYFHADHNYRRITDAITHCHPAAVEAMATAIPLIASHHKLEQHQFFVECMNACHSKPNGPKVLSALYACGFEAPDPDDYLINGTTITQIHWAALHKSMKTAHSRIAMIARDPDPAKIIARPTHSTFHGMNHFPIRGRIGPLIHRVKRSLFAA